MAVIQERREVSGFDQVHMEGSGTISLTQGEQDSLVIEAQEDLLPRIKSEVRDGRLVLGLKHWYDYLIMIGYQPIHYHVTMRQVHGVSISGSCKLESGRLQTDRLVIKISGAGNLSIPDVTTGSLEIRVSGSGKAVLAGAAERLSVDISGSGDLHAEDLPCQEAQLRISGSGSIRANVSSRMEVRISGSGDVRYKGQPNIEPHISGSGNIRPL